MIISYETFRIHAERFAEKGESGVQLVMCDEAHRLKNGDTLTNKALCSGKFFFIIHPTTVCPYKRLTSNIHPQCRVDAE
tara:strand:- start:10491 stop:10727 length:237 start_codon:yes stop_codon:yes gene_type:complete